MRLAQGFQRLEAVEHWHFDIHRDDIGVELRDLRQPDVTVRRRAHDLQVGVGGETVGDHATKHHRVVHD